MGHSRGPVRHMGRIIRITAWQFRPYRLSRPSRRLHPLRLPPPAPPAPDAPAEAPGSVRVTVGPRVPFGARVAAGGARVPGPASGLFGSKFFGGGGRHGGGLLVSQGEAAEAAANTAGEDGSSNVFGQDPHSDHNNSFGQGGQGTGNGPFQASSTTPAAASRGGGCRGGQASFGPGFGRGGRGSPFGGWGEADEVLASAGMDPAAAAAATAAAYLSGHPSRNTPGSWPGDDDDANGGRDPHTRLGGHVQAGRGCRAGPVATRRVELAEMRETLERMTRGQREARVNDNDDNDDHDEHEENDKVKMQRARRRGWSSRSPSSPRASTFSGLRPMPCMPTNYTPRSRGSPESECGQPLWGNHIVSV